MILTDQGRPCKTRGTEMVLFTLDDATLQLRDRLTLNEALDTLIDLMQAVRSHWTAQQNSQTRQEGR